MKKLIVLTAIALSLFFTETASHASGPENIRIHGFISQGYLVSDKNNYIAKTSDGTFQFNEMGINFSTDLYESLRVGIQFFARDFGETGNDEITVPWAFADYSWKEWIGIRVGFIKPPYGFYNEIWDIDTLRTAVLLPQAIYDEMARDSESSLKGAGIYGNVLLGMAGILNYQAMYGDFQAGSGTKDAMENRLGPLDMLKNSNSFCGQLQWHTPLDGLRIAVSYVKNDMEVYAEGIEYTIIPLEYKLVSVEYVIGGFLIGGEACKRTGKRNIVLSTPSTGQIYYETHEDIETGNMQYINLSYRFTEWFQIGAYYSMYEDLKDYNDPADPDDNLNKLNDVCMTLRFDINDNWLVKLEGHKMDGAFSAAVLPEEGEDSADEDWSLFAAKVSYNF